MKEGMERNERIKSYFRESVDGLLDLKCWEKECASPI